MDTVLRMVIQRGGHIALLMGLLVLMAACSSPFGGGGGALHVTTLADTSAANLEADLYLGRGGQGGQDLKVVVGFFVSQAEPHDTIVRFTHRESVTCDGAPLTYDPNTPTAAFQATLTGITGGATLACIYTSSGVATTLSYTLPPDLQILSPKAGDTVPRSKQTSITYAPTGGPDIQGGASNGPEFGGTASGPKQSATGVYTLDTTTVQAGAGSIGLNQQVSAMPTGSGFKSLQVTYDAGASVPVTFV
jgi:hypothetical protein